jgi:hypothetical protein
LEALVSVVLEQSSNGDGPRCRAQISACSRRAGQIRRDLRSRDAAPEREGLLIGGDGLARRVVFTGRGRWSVSCLSLGRLKGGHEGVMAASHACGWREDDSSLVSFSSIETAQTSRRADAVSGDWPHQLGSKGGIVSPLVQGTSEHWSFTNWSSNKRSQHGSVHHLSAY